ncbi:MAG: SGNH/GDSL hydrolase family protein [Gaiellaceae bacterium]
MQSAERVVLCYGDSNTYGSIPAVGGRFPRDVRWPGVLAAELGAGWHVIEEGLGGRTTVFDDPILPDRNGRRYLTPCLLSHAPIDVVVISLGTNDLKARFAASAVDIARGVAVLAELVLASAVGPGGTAPKVLLLGLPRHGPFDTDEVFGGEEKAEAMRPHLRAHATELGVELLELHELVSCAADDGFHFDASCHRTIGEAVAGAIDRML